MKGYVSLALLLSFVFCAEKVSTNTQMATTTTVSTTTETLTTIQLPTTTIVNTTTETLTTTQATTTTITSTTSEAPTTTQASTTTTASTTSEAPTATQASTATTASTTSEAPTATQASTATTGSITSEAPTATQASTATTASTTSEAPTATQASTATTASTTSEAPTATQASTATTASTTSEAPTATQASTATTGNDSPTAPAATTKLPVTTAPPATTEAPLPCANKPCGSSAKCINLYQGYTCQCPYGYYYTASRCQEGKVFPGEFTLKIPYTSSMANENSQAYWDLYRNVRDFFNTTFTNGTGYGETIIVNVKQSSAKSKIQAKAETGETNVIVRNMFEVTTDLNATEVATRIEGAMKDNPYFNNSSYVELSNCAIYGCDEATTVCTETDVITCECKAGFSKRISEDKSCSDCDNTCSEEKHMHCVVGTNSVPVCQCLPNFRSNDGNCIACGVGYSGVNCSNNSLLILIIVAALCGALILGLTAGLLFTSLRANKRQKNPEKRHLLREDYSNKIETPGPVSAINPAANDKIFPKIQTSKAGQENRGFEISNPYEMGPSTRKLPERDYDEEEYEMSSKGDGFRLQRRY